MVGVFDLASNVTEGIRNTTANDTLIDRVRAPRHIGADGILTVSWNRWNTYECEYNLSNDD